LRAVVLPASGRRRFHTSNFLDARDEAKTRAIANARDGVMRGKEWLAKVWTEAWNGKLPDRLLSWFPRRTFP
jgi:hypothetical protein